MARVEAHLKLADQRRALEVEVRERTRELHLKNVRLEEELQARRILEKKADFQLRVQRAASRMAQLQMKSIGLEAAVKEIMKAIALAFDLERLALFNWNQIEWALMADLPQGEAPKLSDEELDGQKVVSDGERLLALDDDSHLMLWMGRDFEAVEAPEKEESLLYLLDEAKLLIRSAKMRDSIANFDLG
jgi:hypothetical protein